MESDNERLDRKLEEAPRGDIPGVTKEDRQLARQWYPNEQLTDGELKLLKTPWPL